MKNKVSAELLAKITENLPPVFSRMDTPALLFNLISVQTLRNLEARDGKPKSYRWGNKSVYIREEFVSWLEEYYGDKGASGKVQGSEGVTQPTGGKGKGVEDTGGGRTADADHAEDA